jgi:hypothetical protein
MVFICSTQLSLRDKYVNDLFLSTIVDVSSPIEPISNGDLHVEECIGLVEFSVHQNVFPFFQSMFPRTEINTFELENRSIESKENLE